MLRWKDGLAEREMTRDWRSLETLHRGGPVKAAGAC